MKSIIVYSGKGGVGKTTTSANLARVLAESGKRVFLLDADVNTPSMNVVFGSESPSENIMVASMGFATDGMIFVEQSMVRKFIRESLKKAKKFAPDFLIVDTPPSITDVHINLIESVDISGMIMVTQPNTLSNSDVNRTALFFENRKINVLGIIENMGGPKPSGIKYSWGLLGSIPFAGEFDTSNALEKYKETYKIIAGKLENVGDIIIENRTKTMFNESISVEDIKSSIKNKARMRFMNVKTWPWVREQIIEFQESTRDFTGDGWEVDGYLDWATSDRVEKFVNAFNGEQQAYFMITKSPNVAGIDTLCGEIGQGTIYQDEKFYNLPRLKYSTFQGEVTLFLHEVTPVDMQEIDSLLKQGGTLTKDGRYLQSKDACRDIANTFGATCGMNGDWEVKYDRILKGE